MEQRTATAAFPRVASGSRSDLESAFLDILASAMRFCEADSGCVVLCDTAGFMAALESAFEFDPAGPFTLKGFPQPVPAFALRKPAR